MTAKNLLVELFVEELPPKALKTLGAVFARTLSHSLAQSGLTSANAKVTSYASPRRLAAHIADVNTVAADKPVVQKLMPVSVGLDASGNATPALLKKLAALGADASCVPGLRRENDGKTDVLFFDSLAKGATLAEGLQKALEAALAALPIPKVMCYQLADGWSSVNFVRPAHALVALHGADVVPISVLGLNAGNATHGHRFEARVDPVIIRDADSYEKQLRDDGAVIAAFAERRAEIARQIAAAAEIAGGKAIEDDALLDEVTALVERPNVLIGQFEAEFLAVPQECLILTMKANQKYFPLLDANGKLTNKFLVVSNIRPEDPSAVIGGNERVVRPRLADAKFFFDQDRKKSLESRLPGLSKVVYHNKLGTQGERVERVAALARHIAAQLGDESLQRHAEQAAMLAKADLLTDMVGEFPELQGIMGRYYAQHDGLAPEVADAIEDHYKPRFAGDALPRGLVGTIVALADKLETLAGMFGIGQVPTGDKDPFALRRHALGAIRMLAEGNLDVTLGALLDAACRQFDRIDGFTPPISALRDFIYERLAGNLREQGYTPQEVDAVLSQRPERLADIPKRLSAVRAFSALPEAQALAAANKRIGNILKKAEIILPEPQPSLLAEDAEKALFSRIREIAPAVKAHVAAESYTDALKVMASVRSEVDHFFDKVMVNVDDPDVRANRLGLLKALFDQLNAVADISKLSV